MIQKWYRGHEGSRHALDNFGIIWLSADPEYAQSYADEYPDGVVSTVWVDMEKLNYFDNWNDNNFDVYDPDMRLVREYMEEGGNCYTFPVEDGIDVLALVSKEPVIKVERKIVENMKLNYNDIRYIMHEATKRILSERYNDMKKEDFSIDIFELEIDPSFEEELDNYSRMEGGMNEVHVICTFDCFEGQKGSYEQEPISPYCNLEDVQSGNNEGLRQSMSPELFAAVINSALDYVWKHQQEFEEDFATECEQDPMDFFDEDEYRYKKLGY